jgi:Asp-tRNA(Asn)/Glu-tRNA(Gln) amidotransferase B subunit
MVQKLEPYQQAAILWNRIEKSDVSMYCLVECLGLWLNDDIDALQKVCEEVLKEHPNVVEDYYNGKKQAINSLIGKVMSASTENFNGKDIRNKLIEIVEKR